MKLLQMIVDGLPLFKETLKIDFFALQRVSASECDSLFSVSPNLYINSVNAFVGINASGKTTVLKTIIFAIRLLQNEPINHIAAKSVLGNASDVVFKLIFSTYAEEVCQLEIHIDSNKDALGNFFYSISSERLKSKKISKTATKKNILDFSTVAPIFDRNKISSDQDFLPNDVSIIIAYNKQTKDVISVIEMLFLTDINFIPYKQVDFPIEFLEFLDPSIEKIEILGGNSESNPVHIIFKNSKEVILEKQSDLSDYLSSGTIKGLTIFTSIVSVLKTGGYLVVDELENHFNKEIVATIIRFFMDHKTNPNGAVLIYSSHYPELLDEHNRNDSIFITKNLNGIYIENFSESLKRNDIKKSDAFQSGYIDGTAPSYKSYIKLKNYIKDSLEKS
ncbi:MAG: ATP-binding protein [Treponema sp.]|nr:ATP-binding protein [Treponema sp.]